MESTPTERFTLTAEDRFPLAAMRWLPKGAPIAVLHVVHGMAEHVARYAPFAQACNAAGIAVYGHDHRGHGGSIREDTPRGHFADTSGFIKALGDLSTMHRHIRANHPDVPVLMLGHSMGSFFARAYLLERPAALAGAIVSATGWRMGVASRVLRRVAQREGRKHGARTPSPLMGKIAFGSFNVQFFPTRTSFDWLSRDAGEVDKYIRDPLCGFDCSAGLWTDLLGAITDIERQEDDAHRLARNVPLLFIAGTRDPVSMGGFGNGQVATRYRRAGNPDVTERRYEGARHELLNETNRAEVHADLVSWLRQRVTARKASSESHASVA